MNKYHVIIAELFTALVSNPKTRAAKLLKAAQLAAGEVKAISGVVKDIEAKATRTKEDNQAKREFVAIRGLLVGAINQALSQLTEGQAKDVSQRLGGNFAKLVLQANGNYMIRYTV